MPELVLYGIRLLAKQLLGTILDMEVDHWHWTSLYKVHQPDVISLSPGGRVSPYEAGPEPDQFKSQFARRLTRADLDLLRQENTSLKAKVELERGRVGDTKLDFLQTELEVLRERVGKVRLGQEDFQ